MLKEIQKQEYLEAKHMDQEKKRKEKEAEMKRIEEEEKERIKAEETQRQREELIKEKSSTIPLEPESNAADSSEIVFRFSSGKRLIRRFPKTCTIQVQAHIIIDALQLH
jgi:FAS-associated factor 2